jgi:hypothetical protein
MVELRLVREDVREGDGDRTQEPRERDDEKPLADAHVLAPLRQRPDPDADAGGDGRRRQEGDGRLRVENGDDRGEEEGEREVAKERADEVERRAHVDVHTPAAAKTRPVHASGA